MPTKTPPIKSQGIKTKLVPLIQEVLDWDFQGIWIEPFTGTGVVGFNVRPRRALFADTNPHTIRFYESLRTGEITPITVRCFLEDEGRLLEANGADHYYSVRDRFNREGNPLDLLFLSRACFNGVMRFNRKGGFNVPFCHKPERFSKSYITKIVNQVRYVAEVSRSNDWRFVCQDYVGTIDSASAQDFIYADPPYVGRHVDFYDSWSEEQELQLFRALRASPARFMLSTWEENAYRRNTFIDEIWSEFPRVVEDHFYHVGAHEENRNSIKEALVMSYEPPATDEYDKRKQERVQLSLVLERKTRYRVERSRVSMES